jgi:hypothetical protein
MAENNEDKLKKLIQSVDLDQPKADFTESLMKEIRLQESLVINTALQSVLVHHIIETPSIDFTQKVMMGVEGLDKKVVYEPIIPKKVWYGIGIAASLLITLVSLFSKSSQTSSKPLPFANNINQITGQIILQINAMPALVLACLLALSALLVLDFFISDRKKYQL